ncbi:drug/metabolite transporter (DMT)-like permease [Kibdelosporangium banguiense]|uniref:Drug/metabolite transporter (DMT)-like permease n=1 Tax=Kibdelosporangium banguiense TaxID=1365924 RepID=A0ABS4TDY3_9PSEU|nr:DMT family transporter [Kibdelosporangium banguiense]MBP2322635.1 drug/metabolite transporter (DMT)-like permease [Kibdelosporangium banguiense]
MLITLSICWGAAYLVIALALQSFSPVVVVLGRVALAAAMLLPLALHRRVLAPLRQHPWWVLITVLLQAAVPMTLLTYGQQWLSTGLTGILIGAQPLFVALLALRFDPAERPQGITGVVGLLLGLAGLVLIFGVDIHDGSHMLLGGILVTAAALCYAIGSMLIHRKLVFAEPLGVATAAMLVATTVLLVPGILSLPAKLPSLPSSLSLLALGIVFTGFTLRLFYGLIARAGPARATLAFYLSPGITVILGWVLLDERITWSTVLGLAAIVVGSVMVGRRSGVVERSGV